MKTIIACALLVMSLSAMAQFIPQQDIPSPAGSIVWSACNSSWFTGTQTRCDALLTAPSLVMWCHCQARCGNGTALDTGYKLWWSLSAGNTGQGHVFSQNLAYFLHLEGDLILYCGLTQQKGIGLSNQFCDGVDQYEKFTLSCDGGGSWP